MSITLLPFTELLLFRIKKANHVQIMKHYPETFIQRRVGYWLLFNSVVPDQVQMAKSDCVLPMLPLGMLF